MLRVENVSERVRPFIAKLLRIRQFADTEGVTNDDDGAIGHAFFFFGFGAEAVLALIFCGMAAEVMRTMVCSASFTDSESGKMLRRSGARIRRLRLRP